MREKYYPEATADNIETYLKNQKKIRDLMLTETNKSESRFIENLELKTMLGNLKIAAKVKDDNMLEKLTLNNFAIGECKSACPDDLLGPQQASFSEIIGKFIKANSNTLKEIVFNNIDLHDRILKKISLGIGKCQKLEYLCFNYCSISNKGAEWIANGLKTTYAIQEVFLNINRIGNSGFVKVVDSLKDKENLMELRMEGNYIGSEAMASLDKLLKNKVLILLSDNEIGDEGLMSLLRIINEDKVKINIINLTRNYISKKVIKLCNLKKIVLDHQHEPPDSAQTLSLTQQDLRTMGAKFNSITEENEKLKAKLAAVENDFVAFKKAASSLMNENLKLTRENTDLLKQNTIIEQKLSRLETTRDKTDDKEINAQLLEPNDQTPYANDLSHSEVSLTGGDFFSTDIQ